LNYVKPDLVCATESFLHGKILSTEFFPSNYTPYRKDRSAIHGGVFILVHKSLVSTAVPEFDTNCEILWVKINLKGNKDLYLGCFYTPKRNLKDLSELDKSLEKLQRQAKGQNQVILAGDFNCPNINWESGTVAPGSPQRDVQEELVDIAMKNQLTQIHDEPTRLKNTLDLVFASNPSLAKFSMSIPGCCDHSAIVSDFNTRPHRTKEKPRKTYLFSKAQWVDIEQDRKPLAGEMSTMKERGDSVNIMWERYKEVIMSAVEKHVPSILRRNRHDLPWMNRILRSLVRKKKNLYKKAKKSGNWDNYRFAQKECRRAMRKAEQQYINNTIEQGLKENNSKPFWRYVKSRRQDNTGVAPLKDGPSLVSDSLEKSKILLRQFCSVFTRDDGTPPPQMKDPPSPNISELNITEEGVAKLLRNLNASKSCGPDGIPSKILKQCAAVLASPLTTIFTHSLQSGNLPNDWLTANVASIFKKGDKNCAENYRPVSLTSVSCKLLEHVICHHLRSHLERYNILTDKNHGFRSGFSCETQLLNTMDDLLKTHDAGVQTDVAILDFSKAFDTVPHAKLLSKLSHYGIKGPIHDWISTFLSKRTMKVVVEGESSEEAPVESGVPQGTVLGPLLFLCHINDLPNGVKSSVRLFADDCLVYREIHCLQDHITLQEDLQRLEIWAKQWGMRFNPSKCYILPTKTKSSYFYKLNNEILKTVDQNPYLGVHISSDLKWSTHITKTCNKAGSLLGFLRRNLGSCPPECRRMAYISMIRSVLEYGATVWDPYQQKDIDRLERVQRQSARFIKRDYTSREKGCVTKMLEDLKLAPLQERRKQLRLTTLYKIAGGHIKALPPSKFLTPVDKSKRKITARTFEGYSTKNIVARYMVQNSRGYKIPENNGNEQYTSSFFIKTVVDWNQLEESTVQAKTVAAFRSAVCREPLGATLQ
jgi:hypothetical protein